MEENRERNGPSKLMTQFVSRRSMGIAKLNVTYAGVPTFTPSVTFKTKNKKYD